MTRNGKGQAGKGKMKPKKRELIPALPVPGAADPTTAGLLGDIRALVEEGRGRVAAVVNTELVMLNWRIGHRICQDILGQERAEYGERVIEALAARLTGQYGRGFSRPNLFHMIRFAEVFPEEQIVYALSRQLSWTHFRALLYLADPRGAGAEAARCDPSSPGETEPPWPHPTNAVARKHEGWPGRQNVSYPTALSSRVGCANVRADTIHTTSPKGQHRARRTPRTLVSQENPSVC